MSTKENLSDILKLLYKKYYIFIISLFIITISIIYIDKFYRKIILFDIKTNFIINKDYKISPEIYNSDIHERVQRIEYLTEFIYNNYDFVIRTFIDEFKSINNYNNFIEKENKEFLNDLNLLEDYTVRWWQNDNFYIDLKVKNHENIQRLSHENITNDYFNFIINITNKKIRDRIKLLEEGIILSNQAIIKNLSNSLKANQKKTNLIDENISLIDKNISIVENLDVSTYSKYIDLKTMKTFVYIEKVHLEDELQKYTKSNKLSNYINKNFDYLKDNYININKEKYQISDIYNITPDRFSLFKTLFFAYVYTIFICIFFIIIFSRKKI